MRRRPYKKGPTIAEWLIPISLFAIIAAFAFQKFSHVTESARQTSQIGSTKHITLACQLFATDNGGRFPNGNYDPILKKITGTIPAATAEACFDDLIKSKNLDVERLFWSRHHPVQCNQSRPNENGTLTAGENCWDYIAGLTNESPATLPLVFEASDGGNATKWSEAGGHPWETQVVVSFVDGSAEKANLNSANELKTERDGTEVHLCLPTPGKNRWPESAKLCPATPIP